MRNIAIVIVGLVLLAGAIYWPVRNYGFIEYDDPVYIYQNAQLRAPLGMESIRYAFQGHVGTWNPLVWLSFYVDRVLFDLRPGPMHVENVLMHLAGSIVLFLFLVDATAAMWRSAMVAALFLCSPMHVESVAWVTERKDVLSTVLFFAAMAGYVRYVKARSAGWYAAALIGFILSLGAKSMGITLPAVLLLLDIWPLRRTVREPMRRLILEKLPFFAMSVGMVFVAAHAQRIAGAASSLVELSLWDRVENALVAYVNYGVKLVAPRNLAVFYPHPQWIPFSQAMAAAMLLVLVTAIAFGLRRDRPFLWIGWLWFIGTLVPVIGIVQIGAQAMADRYSYLPSVGLFIMGVWGATDLATVFFKTDRTREMMLCGCALVVVFVMSVIAHRQVGYWRDTRALFEHAEEVTEDNWVAELELGDLAYRDGNMARAKDEFVRVIQLQPRNAKAYNNLAECVVNEDVAAAIALYRKAIELEPGAAEYHVNLAKALSIAGDREGAISELHQALLQQPGSANAQAGLAELTQVPRSH